MTRPDGEVHADLRITTDKVADDVDRGLDKAGRAAERDAKDTGEKLGEAVSEGMEKRLKKAGPDLARSIERGLDKEHIVTKVTYELDADRNVTRRWVTVISRDMRRAVDHEAGLPGGGIFRGVSSGITDAIGAGFNISGRSPLIAVLVPLIAFIGELIVGALQAVPALVAVLTTLPALLGAIGIQVGVLFLAFKGLGTAIEGAFAAENAYELNQALKELTPSAQDFVRSLLPFRDLMKELGSIAQEGFFGAFGNSMDVLLRALDRPAIRQGIEAIAEAFGGLARTFVTFANDPVFQRFLATIIPATVKWIDDFSPALGEFLVGITNLATAATPFLTWLGEAMSSSLAEFGRWLSDLSVDPDFLAWLERMKETLSLFGTAIGSILNFLVVFLATLDKAGGNEALKSIAEQLNLLAGVLSSEVGIKGLEGLIFLIIRLSEAFIGLIVVVLFLSASLTSFFEWLTGTVFPAIGDFFTNTIPEAWNSLVEAVRGLVNGLFNDIDTAIRSAGTNVLNFFSTTLPETIRSAVGRFGEILIDAGRNIINGLISGIKSRFPNLDSVMTEVGKKIREYLPFSPAKEGPLSGPGDPTLAGQKIVQMIATGMEMELPTLQAASASTASVIFGPNSIQVGFNGALPTTAQATATGAAAGQGIINQITSTRLAVRTL